MQQKNAILPTQKAFYAGTYGTLRTASKIRIEVLCAVLYR